MLKRKIEDQFVAWKRTRNRKPLIVRGVRQCGKTFSVTAFAESNYENVVYVNFVKQESLKLAFMGAKDVDTILMNLSAAMRGVKSSNPQVRVTTGWWSGQWPDADIQPDNENAKYLTDNGDGTWTVEINIAGSSIVDLLDEQHLLFTGDRFTPLKLYFK